MAYLPQTPISGIPCTTSCSAWSGSTKEASPSLRNSKHSHHQANNPEKNLCPKETLMKLKGKKICIPVAHEFEDIELLYPLLRLSEEGSHIVIAAYYGGSSPRPYLGKIKPITGRFGTPTP